MYHQGKIYNTMGDEVLCTDTSGAVLWKHQLTANLNEAGGFGGTPPIFCGGLIIVATLKGEVLLFEAATGKLSQSYQVKEPIRYQPVAGNGWIYVTSEAGRLHAINTGNPSITGWPVWGANAARTNAAVN
jgi:outer membrane protein assembly factor BamB